MIASDSKHRCSHSQRIEDQSRKIKSFWKSMQRRLNPQMAKPCHPFAVSHFTLPSQPNASLCMNAGPVSITFVVYSISPGRRLPLTPNILAETVAEKPSTWRAYCSTCLPTSKASSLLGSVGSLKSFCHSFSSRGGCLLAARAAFSALRFCCHAVIFCCSRPRARCQYWKLFCSVWWFSIESSIRSQLFSRKGSMLRSRESRLGAKGLELTSGSRESSAREEGKSRAVFAGGAWGTWWRKLVRR